MVQTRNVGVQKSSNSIKTSNSSIQKSSETKKKEEEKKKEQQQQQTEEQQEEQREETQKTNQYGGKYLYDMNSILSSSVDKYDSLVTNKENKTVTRALGFNSDGYIEYVAGKKYTKLKATVAPVKNSWNERDRVVLQILGDGTELYVTPDIYYNTDMFDIEVDISGYDIIRINKVTIDGSGAIVGLINARFE